ncbi:MAG TPA: aldehyde dehydrogenase family protein [Thermodesulfobacteriota bacterium]
MSRVWRRSPSAICAPTVLVGVPLAACAFSRTPSTVAAIADALEAGMVAINQFRVSLPEAPFGGVKASGYGSEWGQEGLDAYLVTRFVNQA